MRVRELSHRNPLRALLSMHCALAVLANTGIALAADTTASSTIDWAARTTGQQACVPASANPTTATLKLLHSNSILYSYSLDVRSYQLPADDGKLLPGLASTTKGGVNPATCGNFNSAVNAIWSSSLFPKDKRSIPLDETQAVMAFEKRDIDLVTAGIPDQCTPDNPAATNLELTYLPVYAAVSKSLEDPTKGEIDFTYSIDDKHWNSFTLHEQTRFDSRKTNASLAWKCGLDDILTLSVGTLLTTLQFRTYNSQSVPTSNGTQNELVVSGNGSWTPIGVGLLNYKVWDIDKGPQLGISASTGPAFKLGGTPQISPIGWFVGGSVSIWHRLFISPGYHIGQFADYPPGFTLHSVIPSGFGTLTPTTRWSTRFAIGITFQTNSLIKSDQSTPTSAPTQKPSGSQPAAKQVPASP